MPASTRASSGPDRGAAARRFARNSGAVAGMALLALIAAAALAAPWLYPGDPKDLVAPPLTVPFTDPAHWLGTDRLGRDVAAGLFHGARVSLLIGVTAALFALVVGLLIGAVAGYYGGWTDEALMRVTEAFQTVPGFVLALALVAVMGASVASIVVAIAAISWPQTARIVRAEMLSLRARDFVEAYRAMGMGDAEIILRQLLPNAVSSVLVLASVIVASAILIESALSFLGLGDPNVVSWGGMIAEGRAVLRTAWWLSAIPGIAIIVTVIAVSLVGEGLTDALNPRSGRR